jgi:hypothetical protein
VTDARAHRFVMRIDEVNALLKELDEGILNRCIDGGGGGGSR